MVQEANSSSKVVRPNKKRKFTTPTDQIVVEETFNIMDNDEFDPFHMSVTFSKPLVNPFEGEVFGCKYKLNKVYNYFAGLDDEAVINKAHKKKLRSIFLMRF